MPATIPLLQEGRYSIEQEFPYVENCLLFQAYDTQNETPVTIVEVPLRLPKVATVAQREAVSASFADQAKVLVGFKHKSVVAIRSFFTEAGRNYLVTDRVDGVDLASVLADQTQPFTVAQMSGWADTLLDALNVMHNSRPALVYRNLRPENIVLGPDGSVDLAMAGILCGGDQRAASSTINSSSGSSIAYSPLEQIWSGLDAASQKVIINKYDEASERILKQDLDARSDLYSLGATLYKLVTGQTPVDALERSIEMIEGNPDPLKSPNGIDPAIPVEVSDVIMKAMEIKREYRFDSAAIMRQVMKTALVRVKERKTEEALVQKVEQHDVSPAVQSKPAPPVQNADEEAIAKKLREAEEKRLEAERRAAEAERKLRETETRVTEAFNLAELEDDVLGLLSPSAHTSEAPQAKNVPAVTQTVIGPEAAETSGVPTVLEEPIEPIVEQAAETAPESVIPEPFIDEAAVEEDDLSPVEPSGPEAAIEPEPEELQQPVEDPAEVEAATAAPLKTAAAAAFSSSYDDDRGIFAEHKTGRGMGLPAIAAAAVVLCVAAVGGWFYFGSSPSPSVTAETPAASQPAQPDNPARTAFQPNEPATTETSAPPATEQPVETPNVGEVNGQDPPDTVASAAPAKAKKPAAAPARTPAPKKAVTVDDLINDN